MSFGEMVIVLGGEHAGKIGTVESGHENDLGEFIVTIILYEGGRTEEREDNFMAISDDEEI